MLPGRPLLLLQLLLLVRPRLLLLLHLLLQLVDRPWLLHMWGDHGRQKIILFTLSHHRCQIRLAGCSSRSSSRAQVLIPAVGPSYLPVAIAAADCKLAGKGSTSRDSRGRRRRNELSRQASLNPTLRTQVARVWPLGRHELLLLLPLLWQRSLHLVPTPLSGQAVQQSGSGSQRGTNSGNYVWLCGMERRLHHLADSSGREKPLVLVAAQGWPRGNSSMGWDVVLLGLVAVLVLYGQKGAL